MKNLDEERFNYIEHILWWEGQINASDLMRRFNLSRDTASTTLKRYEKKHPYNLHYDQSAKARLLTEHFVAENQVNHFDNYLNLIKSVESDQLTHSVQEVDAPLRNIQAPLIRPILKAIREKLAVDIGYISLSSPDYLDRIIEPHSLIFDGLRWHVRAYCRKNSEFRDFVLSRFNGDAVFEGKASQPIENDHLWQTYVDIEIMPDSRLSELQQTIIANDFQMQNHRKTLTTRAALVNYLLLRLRIDTHKNTPEEQQVVLTPTSRKAITKYLPKPME